MRNEGKKSEIKWYSSINTKIISVIITACIISVTICLVILMPKCREVLKDYVHSYMLSMASENRDILELREEGADDLNAVYADVLKDIKVEGAEGSYAYLVSADGTMLYHPTAEKIGSPVENEAVSGVVKKLESGTVPQDAVVSYLYKGKIKYAGYAITASKEILVVTADEDMIMAPISQIRVFAIIANMIIVVLCGIIGALVALMITKPLAKLKDIIQNTGNFNFKHNPNSDAMCKRQDETGAMARAIRDMRGKLRSLVTSIDAASDQITANVNKLQEATNTVNSMCTDNSATTQELAAGMQETAATTETIHNNVGTIREGAVNIETLSVDGAKLSNDVMDRAVALKDTTDEASAKTKKMYESVKEKSDSAIEGSKAVDKINELTDTIMAISSQTSLLALNASIEAARAGEAGRGFAVVATEIGNLADQTSKAIADINSIVGEVNGAVDKMSECLEETTKFLETTVLGDFNEFSKVGVQYSEDATQFKSSMNGIHDAVTNLSESISVIADALEGISATISESTVGVSDIAEKTTDMVGKASENYELVNESLSCAKQLSEMVDQFILE